MADSTQFRVLPPGHEELVEGLARVIYRTGAVFYNPAQVVNRDLSVLVLHWFQRQRNNSPLRVLEALSATGLRSIRYATEVPNVVHVLANDLDPAATETIARNVAYNGSKVQGIVVPNCGDAIHVMTAARAPEQQYDVIDLDPYGGAAPFMDSAVQAVRDGGLLCVTCTDLAVLCGNSPETCFARYGATPLKGPSGHEMAVRIVLHAINGAANRHGRAVEVVFCAKIDFYVRLFVRIRNSKAIAQLSHSRTAMVYQCTSCGTQRFQTLGRVKEHVTSNTHRKKRKHAALITPRSNGHAGNSPKDSHNEEGGALNVSDIGVGGPDGSGIRRYHPAAAVDSISARCSVCQGTMIVGGPIWAGALVDRDACRSILSEIAGGAGVFKARDRVEALIRVSLEEVPDAPLFMQLNAMCKILHCNAPPSAALRTCLESKGYSVSQSHTDPQALKTNAPPEMLWDILRIWALQHKSKKTTSSGYLNQSEDAGNTVQVTTLQSPSDHILATKPSLVTTEDIDFSIKKDRFVRRCTSGVVRAPRFLPNPEPNWGPKPRAGKRKRCEDTIQDETA